MVSNISQAYNVYDKPFVFAKKLCKGIKDMSLMEFKVELTKNLSYANLGLYVLVVHENFGLYILVVHEHFGLYVIAVDENLQCTYSVLYLFCKF